MADKGTCGTCKWWKQDDRLQYPQFGKCRRNPPVVAVQRAENAYVGPCDEWVTEWPRPNADDYCGEHTERT